MVVDQVMKAMEPCDPWMCAYYNEVHKLEEKIKGFNAEANELSTIASGRKPVPDGVFASDLYKPSTKSSNQRDKQVRRMMTKWPARPRLEGWWS
jgi:hypothetical protein